jgi:hypothetical protein
MPPPWVWTVFALSALVLTCSMLTLREGRRFQSRELHGEERTVVTATLDFWTTHGGDAGHVSLLRTLLQQQKIRAMDRATFSRAAERNVFGYTDERGRILLNPNLCFAYQRTLAPRLCGSVHEGDLVATLATLYHELRHLLQRASEAQAYEDEWRFVRALQVSDTAVQGQLQAWERQMPVRVARHVGPQQLQEMLQRLRR